MKARQPTPEPLETILKRKNLPLNLFIDLPVDVDEHDIDSHAKWVYEHIYAVPYPDAETLREAEAHNIARYFHGIQHVSRAALYVMVFANLYRRHGDKDAQALTEEDVKLLQIAALFHDSAREDENIDRWDHESAILLYHYLRKILKVEPLKAKQIAEATANKDAKPKDTHYFEIVENEHGHVTWQFSNNQDLLNHKNIYQKIIHDADCLDIIRARLSFDATYLDFYKEIASKEGNDLALDEMAHLITEARSFIDIQGDSYNRTKPEIKKQYECGEAYTRTQQDIDKNRHCILHTLSSQLHTAEAVQAFTLIDLEPFNPQEDLTDSNMQRAMREGKLLVRGIATPSAICETREKETLAALEVRKVMRQVKIATKSKKSNRSMKHGNPLRSTSMISYGSGIYSDAGFLMIDFAVQAITDVSTIDSGSGRGKKSHQSALRNKAGRPSTKHIKADLAKMHKKLKLGGEAHTDLNSTHVEILYDVTKYDAIYYSHEPNLANQVSLARKGKDIHPFSALLQAVFLQKQYEQQYKQTREDFISQFGEKDGIKKFEERFGVNAILPIFEYSGTHHQIKQIPDTELTDEKIIAMWVRMCSDYMAKEVKKGIFGKSLQSMSIDDIKTLSMYTNINNMLSKYNAPADSNYPPLLKEAITKAIALVKEKSISAAENTIFKKIIDEQLSVFEEEVFLNLLKYPSLCERLKPIILEQINQAINSPDLLTYEYYFSREIEIPEKIPYDNFVQTYHLKAIRVYELAKRCGQSEITDSIKQQLIEQKKEIIAQWISKLKADDCNNKVYGYAEDCDYKKLVNILAACDCYSELKIELDHLLNAILSHINRLRNNSKIDTDTYHDVILNIHKNGWLSIDHQKILRSFLFSDREWEWNYFQLSVAIRHALVYQVAGIEQKKIKTLVMNCLNKKTKERKNTLLLGTAISMNEYYLDESIIKNINLAIPLFKDENKDLFKLIIKYITLKYNPTYFNSFSHLGDDDPCQKGFLWLAVISAIQDLSEAKEFNSDQLNIVNYYLEKLSKGLLYEIAHNRSILKQLTKLASLLKALINSRCAFDIPNSLIEKFDYYLGDAIKEPTLLSDLTDEQINLIKFLHDILPDSKEARSAPIEQLLKLKYERMFGESSSETIAEYVKEEMASGQIDIPQLIEKPKVNDNMATPTPALEVNTPLEVKASLEVDTQLVDRVIKITTKSNEIENEIEILPLEIDKQVEAEKKPINTIVENKSMETEIKELAEDMKERFLQGIEAYLKRNGSHLCCIIKLFDRDRGKTRAISYKYLLTNNNSSLNCLVICLALLSSYSGETLQIDIIEQFKELNINSRKKLLGITQEMIKKLVNNNHEKLNEIDAVMGEIICAVNYKKMPREFTLSVDEPVIFCTR